MAKQVKAEHVNPCDCTITALPPQSLSQTAIQMRIDFCPLHANATVLLKALERLAQACTPSVKSRLGTRMPEREVVDAAREAILLARGAGAHQWLRR